MQTEKNAFKFTDAHKATQEHATKFGLTIPAFAEKGISFDAYAVTSNVNPYQYTDEGIVYLRDEYEGVDSLMFVFGIALGMDTETAMKKIGAWTHELAVDGNTCHIAYRTMGNFDDRKLRAFIYRVYLNDENLCEEHSEMHKGQPMGMYHCPVCMEMVVAGLRHPSKSELRQFHEELIDDIRDESAVEDEIWSPGDVEQMQARVETRRASCKEENPSTIVENSSPIPDVLCGIVPIDESPEGWTTHEVSKAEYDGVMESANVNFPTGSQWESTLGKIKSYLELEAGWDMNHECPAPVQESVWGAVVFLVRMFNRNPSLVSGNQKTDPIGAPIAMLDHEGIVSLVWNAKKGDYISFAFYPEKEIVGYYKFPDGSTAYHANLDDEGHLNKSFALIQEFGGGEDARP